MKTIFRMKNSILIARTLLNKSKKILTLSNEYEISKNIDQTLSSSKPPIFWKDKEITKQQKLKQNKNLYTGLGRSWLGRSCIRPMGRPLTKG